jgi:hypothetical protein
MQHANFRFNSDILHNTTMKCGIISEIITRTFISLLGKCKYLYIKINTVYLRKIDTDWKPCFLLIQSTVLVVCISPVITLKKLCTLPTVRIYEYLIILRINRDYFPSRKCHVLGACMLTSHRGGPGLMLGFMVGETRGISLFRWVSATNYQPTIAPCPSVTAS